jgi:hypothetical protein
LSSTSDGARQVPSQRTRARRGSAVLRIALGALATAVVLTIPSISAPEPAAASSCTGWSSTKTPPPTIRVLRTRKGKVETVDFRRYVAVVMASGEWPTRLQKATLEAGAVATKQYAWYYTLKGHHRPSYKRGGKCYDVRDDVKDQLYKPERAEPTAKQQRAIDNTWGLTLRKRGRFFLTGYRFGSTTKCAADANGWKLFERSADACAKKGWSRQRIQETYYKGGLKLVWNKGFTGPAVTKPRISLRSASLYPSRTATITWAPVKARADVDRYRLQHKVGDGAWRDVALRSRTATKVKVKLKPGKTHRFRVFARDSKGARGAWAVSAARRAALHGPRGATLSGGAEPAGEINVARTRFKGRSVAYVAPTGPGMGEARVKIDGKVVATVNLSRSTAANRIVWARNWPRSAERRIVVRPVDPDEEVGIKTFFVIR